MNRTMGDAPLSWRAAWCLLAALTLGAAIQIHDGEYSRWAIALVGVAIVLGGAAAWERPALGRAAPRVVTALCAAGCVAQIVWGLRTPLSGQFPWNDDLASPDPRSEFRPHLATILGGLAMFFAMTLLSKRRNFCALAVVAMLLAHLAVSVWLLRNSPSPHIDTFVFQKEAGAALRRGENPYAITMPDIYDSVAPGARAVYGEGMVKDGRVETGYTYPPMNVLFGVAADVMFGDPRFALAIAATLAGGLIAFTQLSRRSILAAAILLWTPRGYFVVGRAWIDPIVLLTIAAFASAAVRVPRAAPFLFGFVLVAKQYLFLLIPPAWLLPWGNERGRFTRFLVVAGLTGAAIIAPFLLWGPGAMWNSLVHFALSTPPREDALTFTSAIFRATGVWLPKWIAFAPLLAAYAVVLRGSSRGERSVSRFLAAGAFVLLVFFAFNKHAFANYYYLVLGIFCCAAAVDDSAHESAQGRESLGVSESIA